MKLFPVEQPVDAGTTIRGWRSESQGRPLLFFLHGNGFCGPVYLPMLRELQKDFDLLMLDIPGHGVSDSIKVNWNQAAELLYQALAKQLDTLAPQSVYGVGHSLGGVLTLLSAHRHPGTFNSIVLLDPVLFPRRMVLLMQAAGLLQLTHLLHPLVRPTLARRRQWPDAAAASDYLCGRKIFVGWADEALQAYVDFALKVDDSGGVELRCDPRTEARYFATVPRGLWKALREVNCKTTCIMGENSFPFALEAVRNAVSVNANINEMLVPGGHFYMQQNPLEAVRYIKATTAPGD